MKRETGWKNTLVVSEEAARDFQSLSTSQRLRWLDEMRTFLSRTLSAEAKRIYEELRQGWEMSPEERLKRTMRMPPKKKLEWLDHMRKIELESRRRLKSKEHKRL